MEMTTPKPFRRVSILGSIILFCFNFLGYHGFLRGVTSLGINYGQVGNNLPPPEKVLSLLSSLKLTRARIYDTNPQVLTAFANSNVELIVTIENEMLVQLTDPLQALKWVNTHIRPYFPATRIAGIAVGNEILTSNDDMTLAANLMPAMVSIHAALAQLGLDPYIEVSTPNSLAILSQSFPPSAGTFKNEANGVVYELAKFLASTGSSFWINCYPYFAYKDDPTNVSLDYVLFNPNSGTVDPYTGLHYDNMLYAQVDAVIFAIARMGFGGLEVKVSETGWPSKGDENEVGATIQNAAIYNKNLMTRQLRKEGTPLRPHVRLEVFVFALFNEDMKPGPTSERNYGLFQPDGTMAYNVGLSTVLDASSTSASSSSASSSSVSPASTANKVSLREHRSLVNLVLHLLVFRVLITIHNNILSK